MGIFSAVMGGASALSGLFGSSQASKERRQARARLRQAAFRPVTGTGAGGVSGGFNPETGQLSTELGAFLPAFQDMLNTGSMFANQAQGVDLSGSQGALQALSGATGGVDPNASFFSALQGQLGGGLGLAGQGLSEAAGGVDPALGNLALGQAFNQFGDISGGQAARSQQLDLLRREAAPFEQRAFSNLQDNLFSTGRLGTTGGGIQTEAFARGLGQADLSRQLAAAGEGRAFQNNAFNLGSGLANVGFSERSLSDNLLGQAFNRFGDFAGLASDVEGRRFNQGLASNTSRFGQLGSVFDAQNALAGLRPAVQNQFLQGAGSAFSGAANIQNIPLQFLNAALGGEQMRSNAALGVGSSMAANAGQTNFADGLSAAFSGLQQASQSGVFDGIFGRKSGGVNSSLEEALRAGVS